MKQWANHLLRVLRGAASLLVLAVGGFLLLSGLMKLADPEAFATILAEHALLSDPFVVPIAWIVAVGEVLVGAATVSWLLRGVLVLSLAALIQSGVFAAFTTYALLLTFNPPPEPASCGCGITSSAPVEDWSGIASRNGLWAAGLAVVAFCARRGG